MNNRQDTGRFVGAAILIGLGLIFLLDQFVDFSFIGQLWPFLIILPGLAFLSASWVGGEKSTPLAYPGMIIIGTGTILLVQNVTGRFESWAYVWALYPVFFGVASMFVGRRTHNDKTYNDGHKALTTGLILFGMFAVFFEGFIFGNLGNTFGRFALPVLLIAVGGLMLFQGRIPFLSQTPPSKPKHHNSPLDSQSELQTKDESVQHLAE